MEYFADSFEEYLLSRIQEGTDQHREKSLWYRFLCDKREKDFVRVEELMKGFSEEGAAALTQHFENEFQISAEEEVVIYQQGLKDGIRILKYLEVL